ncbi:MAG: aminotransferase class I/II-fold pyridoxal phosphate-dependent enzyme [Clostridia bacterium]|nr:aminotransferase class I/II-fold pyridoxal phosphate-dependent enzyme [Clostridia bacterium]
MKTPIYDFVKKYAEGNTLRAHMPGHKGHERLGCEKCDITEIAGADSLYDADGIILESEKNTSSLFGSGASFFSTEGSSQCIKAMVFAAVCGKSHPHILAARNAHKAFISAAALTDAKVTWLPCSGTASHCGGTVTSEEVEKHITASDIPIDAVYITSPDYLGEISDIKGISAVTRKYDIPLLTDNAHGAYLNFFGMHPITLGADMCCDSAHKTLPALTGGAYLHLSRDAAEKYYLYAKNGLSLFGSTSPSYLTLASLDLCNKYLQEGHRDAKQLAEKISGIKSELKKYGFSIIGEEPYKISIACNGRAAAEHLREFDIECEFADSSVLVLMLTPDNSESDILKIKKAFEALQPKDFPPVPVPAPPIGTQAMTIREAIFSKHERIKPEKAAGRICASAAISCPPAVPLAMCGEIITEQACEALKRYGIKYIDVVKK